MRVVCTRNVFTIEDPAKWGMTSAEKRFARLRVGEEYLVLGISVRPDGPYRCMPLLEIDTIGSGTILSYPLSLFRISDGRPSRLWRAGSASDNSAFTLWPELFGVHSFHDRLSSGDETLERAYRDLLRQMETEHQGPGND